MPERTICSECNFEFVDGHCDCISEELVKKLIKEHAKNTFLEKQLETIQAITQDEYYDG